MTKIAVTGGLGFIGYHLCKRLPDGVLVIDNFHTGLRANHHARHPFIAADVRFPLVGLEPVDQIYHLACPAAPEHYQRDPLYTFTTAVHGTHEVLKWAMTCAPTVRVVIASTSEVYGDPTDSPQLETYNGNVSTIGIRSAYDEGKRAAETLAWIYRQRGLDVRIARIFNTMGPRMREDDGRVVPNFIKQARAGEPMTLYGDGKQTRSFCAVDDLVDGLVALMDYPERTPWVFNLGNPQETTIIDLGCAIAKILETAPRFAYRALPENDPKRRCPDITLAKRHLGWEPKVELEEGLRRTIDLTQKSQT